MMEDKTTYFEEEESKKVAGTAECSCGCGGNENICIELEYLRRNEICLKMINNLRNKYQFIWSLGLNKTSQETTIIILAYLYDRCISENKSYCFCTKDEIANAIKPFGGSIDVNIRTLVKKGYIRKEIVKADNGMCLKNKYEILFMEKEND